VVPLDSSQSKLEFDYRPDPLATTARVSVQGDAEAVALLHDLILSKIKPLDYLAIYKHLFRKLNGVRSTSITSVGYKQFGDSHTQPFKQTFEICHPGTRSALDFAFGSRPATPVSYPALHLNSSAVEYKKSVSHLNWNEFGLASLCDPLGNVISTLELRPSASANPFGQLNAFRGDLQVRALNEIADLLLNPSSTYRKRPADGIIVESLIPFDPFLQALFPSPIYEEVDRTNIREY